MKVSSRNKLDKVVRILNRLYFKNEDIMVTGSVALDMLGVLPENRETNDVDVLVKSDDQTWRCMRLLEAIGNEKENNYPESNKSLIFKFDDLTINVWRVKCFEESSIKDSKTGVFVSPVNNILYAKKEYGRTKDFKDVIEICKNILVDW